MPVALFNPGTAAAAAGVARFLQSFSHGRSNPRFHFPSLTHSRPRTPTYRVLRLHRCTIYSCHVLLRHYRDSNLVIIKGGLNSNIIFISLPTLQKRKKGTGKKVFDFVKIGVSWFQNLMFFTNTFQ